MNYLIFTKRYDLPDWSNSHKFGWDHFEVCKETKYEVREHIRKYLVEVSHIQVASLEHEEIVFEKSFGKIEINKINYDE